MKKCRDCGELKPLTEFPPSKRNRDGRVSYCRPCMRKRHQASYRRRMAEQGRTVRELRDVPNGYRWCPDCETVKELSEFPTNPSGRQGYGRYCKPCHNIRGRENRTKNWGSTREYHLQHRYGIGQDEVNDLLELQDGGCGGCRRPDPGHVDHDHETGEVRGILCFNCNQALGNVRDDIAVLNGLIGYLETVERNSVPQIPRLEIRFVGVAAEVDPDGSWHRREPQQA